MTCPRCQHENPPHAKLCLECGARFAVACVQCGTPLPVGAKFCLECGKPTDGPEVETAEAHFQQGLALATELGMRPLVAHCHLSLGKLYRRTGDRAKAEEHFTTARAMYQKMGIGFWLQKARAACAGSNL
jgi:hypothetical protein